MARQGYMFSDLHSHGSSSSLVWIETSRKPGGFEKEGGGCPGSGRLATCESLKLKCTMLHRIPPGEQPGKTWAGIRPFYTWLCMHMRTILSTGPELPSCMGPPNVEHRLGHQPECPAPILYPYGALSVPSPCPTLEMGQSHSSV